MFDHQRPFLQPVPPREKEDDWNREKRRNVRDGDDHPIPRVRGPKEKGHGDRNGDGDNGIPPQESQEDRHGERKTCPGPPGRIWFFRAHAYFSHSVWKNSPRGRSTRSYVCAPK